VKRKGKIVVMITLALMVPVLTFASDRGIVKFQGVVMVLDLKQNSLTVNERTFSWDLQTLISNERGQPVTADKLKLRGWVYIEGVPDKANRRNIAKKIYLIPKFIEEKDRHLYPFMD
jgi:hypothetical protein